MSESELKQRLQAILAADVAGYSRLMAADERATVAALDAARGVCRGHVNANLGRVIDMAGDSLLAVFETAAGAIVAALAIQRELHAALNGVREDRCLRFRIGVHLGDVIEKTDGTVYGDGVNIAARLQTLAEPGGIAVSDAVMSTVRNRVSAVFVDQGEQTVKNIPNAIRWYRVVLAQPERGIALPRERTAHQLNALPSIAILPFKTANKDSEHASLADGLRIDVQAALVKIAGLVVIAPGTVNAYRNTDKSLQQAASEMGVRHLVEGYVQKSGNRVRITVTLIDGLSGQVIWSKQYDRVLDDSFAAQDEITERIVTALDVKLASGEQAKVWRMTLRNSKARELFYRGVHEFMKGQKEAMAAAREHFEQVARLAPQSSLGSTYVAFSHWWDAFRGWSASRERSFELATQWAERAMSMDDADGQAHVVMGHIHLLRREHDKALEVAEHAVTIRPNCTHANGHLGNILYFCGRPADAADRIRQAMRFSPIHPLWFKVMLAASVKETRNWDEATAVAKDALRSKSDEIDVRLILIEICCALGNDGGAHEFAREISALRPDFSVSQWAETQPYRDLAALERIAATLQSAGLAP